MRISLFVLTLLCLTITTSARAQKKKDPPKVEPPAPIALSPQAPTIEPVYPFGMTRGSKIELTIGGKGLDTAIDLATSFPSKATIKSKSASEVKATLEVPDSVPVGYYTLRVLTAKGISNASLFCIDDLPQIIETDGNQDRKTPQVLTWPCVVVGKADEDKSDWFKVTVIAGQRLSFEVIGHRLGNPIDPILKLYDAKNGRELPGTYSDDPPCLQTDARITHTFTTAGEYLIEMRDTQFRGGANYHYRLRIGDFPVGLVVEPLFVQAGQKATVKFPAATIADIPSVEIVAPQTIASGSIDAIPTAKGQSGWPLPVRLSDMTELLEKEPNNLPSQAMELPVPCGVSAGFQTKGDVDFYRFAAKKGTKYTVAAETYDINTPAEVYLQILDKDQKPIAKSDPMQTTARVEFTADADATYFIKAEHLNFLFGPGELYHLTLKTDEPDFDLELPTDRCEAVAGMGTLIPVAIKRKGYTGEVKLLIEGSKEVSGEVIVPADAAFALLPVKIVEKASKTSYSIAVRGEAIINGKPIHRYGNRFEAVKKELGGLLYPPLPMTRLVAVGVIPRSAVRGELSLADSTLNRTKPTDCPVKIRRDKSASGDVTVTVVGLPESISAIVKPLAKGSDETTVTLKVDPKAPAGRVAFALRFSTKVDGQEMVSYSPLLETLIAK